MRTTTMKSEEEDLEYQSGNGRIVTQDDSKPDVNNDRPSSSLCVTFSAYLATCITGLVMLPFVISFGPAVYTIMSTANALDKPRMPSTIQILGTIGAAIGSWKAAVPLAEKITGVDNTYKELADWQYLCICLFFATLGAAIVTKAIKKINNTCLNPHEGEQQKNEEKQSYRLNLVGFFKNCFQTTYKPCCPLENNKVTLQINAAG